MPSGSKVRASAAQAMLGQWTRRRPVGDTSVPRPVQPSDWLDRAGGRPEWLLWGKAKPDTDCPAHPVICHMLDVAAVAARLSADVLPCALRSRLLSLHASPETAMRRLLFVVALHDLGKATPAFQAKVEWAREELPRRGLDLDAPPNAAHHGDVGMFLLGEQLTRLGASIANANALARAVAAHHGQFPPERSQVRYLRTGGPDSREMGVAPEWGQARTAIVDQLGELFGVVDLSDLPELDGGFVMLLAGLTSVADWVGSMSEVFRYEPPHVSAEAYWPIALERAAAALERAGMRAEPPATEVHSFAQLFAPFAPWPLHVVADEVAQQIDGPTLVVVEAPMGEGKTEAALVLAGACSAAGQDGLYVGLPTQATANQMFTRVRDFLNAHRASPTTLLLAHGEAALVEAFRELTVSEIYDPGGRRTGKLRAEGWFLSKKRRLLAPYAVGTIDQALLSVMRVPHLFVRLFGLAGKTVILDEVHAYDTYSGTLLDRLLQWLGAFGTSVVLLSATLPSARRDELVAAYRRGAGWSGDGTEPGGYPRLTVTRAEGTETRHFTPRRGGEAALRVRLERVSEEVEPLAARVVDAARDGGCVGWICNTVARAQEAYRAVRERAGELDVLLIHARLLPEDRQARQEKLLSWLGRDGANRPARCVVIGTQVLEQSLDVDFDLMVTDVAPIDLVLQRAGRLWRHERGAERSPARAAPELWIAQPDGAPETASLDGAPIVYAEDDALLVRRTLQLLDRKDALVLPDDIATWVEAVYGEERLSADDPLFDDWAQHLLARRGKANKADERTIPRPGRDGVFEDLRVFLEDEDDPLLHENLKAETRLGRPSLKLVCVERRGGRLWVGDETATQLDLERTPDHALTARLVRRSIGVSRPAVVQALLVGDPETRPAGWRDSALLRHRRLVAFEDGEATVGGVQLTLDPDLGLVLGT